MIEVLSNTQRLRKKSPLGRKYLYVMNERRFLEGTRGPRQQLRIRRGRIEAMLLQEQLEAVVVENLESDHANGADGIGNRLVATSITGEETIYFVPIDGFLQIPFVLS